MSLSKEIQEFAATFSTVSNEASAAQYRAARAQAAGVPKPKDQAQAEADTAGERGKRQYDQRASAIPVDTPDSGASNLPVVVRDELLRRGVRPEVAAGAVGSLAGESGARLDPTAYNPNDNGGPSGGLAQWHGPRLEGLYKFAGATDLSKIPASMQAKYLGHELDTSHSGVLAALRRAKTAEEGTDIWTRQFEVPANVNAEVQRRIPYGRKFLAGWGGQGAIPAFAAGGLVEYDDMSDLPELDTPSALPVSEAQSAVPAQAGPSAFDPMQLVAKVGGALHDGMQYLQSFFGLNEATAGAIPGGAAAADGMRRFLSNEGEASPEDYEAVVRVVDPNRQLNEGLRNAAGLSAVHDYWLSKGDPEKAAKTAGSLLKYMRGLSARYGTEAVDHLRAGRFEDATSALNKSIDQMPDGKSLDVVIGPGGSAAVIQKDAQGKPIAQKRLSPEQLLGIATGLSDSTLYWKTLVESAGKFGGTDETANEAYARSVGAVYSDQPQAQPQQAISTEPAQGVTPGGNAVAGQPQAQQEAIPTGPAPIGMPTPEDLAAMNPQQRANILAIRGQEMGARKSAFAAQQHEKDVERRHREALDAEDRREARKQSAIPTPETRQHLSTSIGQSMEDFKAGLPQGTTLPAHLEHGYKTAAFAIARDNNIDPSEAVFAADELASLSSRALANASAGEGGRMRVQLGNGSQLTLDQSAYNALRQLRAKQGEEMKAKSEKHQESDAAYTRAGNMIERGAGLAAKNSAIGRAAPYAQAAGGALQDWLKSQWDAYQNSKDPRTVTLNDK